MTTKQLETLGREWQRRLRLQDWDITFAFTPRQDIEADGRAKILLDYKLAKVLVCNEATFQDWWNLGYDPEQILVHELVHLQWAGIDEFKEGTLEFKALELAIERTATALVQIKRGL